MDKNKILRQIGFSQKYLEALENYNRDGIGKVIVCRNVFGEPLRGKVSDTSELSINKTVIEMSTSLSIKHQRT